MENSKFLSLLNNWGLFNYAAKTQFLLFFAVIALAVSFIFYLLGITWLSVLLTLLFCLGCGYGISYYVSNLISAIIEAFEKNRNEDKNYRIPEYGKNEFKQIAYSFNSLLDQKTVLEDQLKSLLNKIDATTKVLSKQLLDNAEVSAAQSSSVAETTATIKELATSAERIVQETSTVVGLAEETQHSAQKGADAIIVMLEKMSEIQAENQRRIQEIVVLGKKAQEIEKVMDIINDIASNTKIIAFNAGIEAASAGESGKRFGTVAAEIRKLANTVSNSTNEIRDKIKEIQKTTNELVIVSEEETKKIQGGVDTAQTMVKELTDILEKADKTLGWVKQISIATQQQLTASDQVAIVLHDISEGVKKFATAANQTKETSAELKTLSSMLSKMTA